MVSATGPRASAVPLGDVAEVAYTREGVSSWVRSAPSHSLKTPSQAMNAAPWEALPAYGRMGFS